MSRRLLKKIAWALDGPGSEPLFYDRHVQLTRAQVRAKIGALITEMDRAFPPAARVGIYYPNCAAQAMAVLACLLSERCPVLFHFYSQHPDFLEVEAVITHAAQVRLPHLIFDFDCELKTSATLVSHDVPPRSHALVLFTSGSLGGARGVQITDQAIEYVADQVVERLCLDPSTVAAIALPLSHVMALNTQFFPTLFVRGKCHFLDTPGRGSLYREIDRCRATFLTLVPEALKLCALERARSSLLSNQVVNSVGLSGEAILPSHLQLARELFPKARIQRTYGLTQATRIASIDSDHPRFESDGVGILNPGMEVEIRVDGGEILAHGQSGQIWVRGPTLATGYTDGSPLAIDRRGFFATGDVGSVSDDGLLFVDGRTDGIFKIDGLKVSALEIERACLQLDFIASAKCLGVAPPDQKTRMILFLTMVGQFHDHLLDQVELSLRKLEAHKRPRRIFLLLNFPRTTTGKVDIQKLVQTSAAASSRRYVRNGIEFMAEA